MHHPSSPKVYIVIVNWNGVSDTLECLTSLENLDYPNAETVVVDNGSTDDSVKLIRNRFPDVFVIEAGENLGFTGGNNRGITFALENGADHVWLLNNDTIVDRDTLTHLVGAASASCKNGIVGSVIYDYEDRSKIQFAGATINWKKARSPHIYSIKQNSMFEVERVNGCSMLVSRRVCNEVGLFDDNYFLYAEEVDWCIRARNNGFRCIMEPHSKVYHKVSVSVNKVAGKNTVMRYYNTRNFLYLTDKLCPHKSKKTYIRKFIFKQIKKDTANFIKLLLSEVLPVKLVTAQESPKLFAIKDYLCNNMGKTLFINK